MRLIKGNTIFAYGSEKIAAVRGDQIFPNVLQYPPDMKGKWKDVFGNDNPITLELACGKGEYTVALAELYPERNFIGVDLKGNRLWVGARKALQKDLKNAMFLRSQIEMIDHYFEAGEISEIWITFPDPQLRMKRSKKRLTHPNFLKLYQKFLSENGRVHLKTDSPVLYKFTQKVLDLYHMPIHSFNEDVHGTSELNEELKIKTYYESLDIAESNRVYYLSFMLTGTFVDKEEELKEIIRSFAEA